LVKADLSKLASIKHDQAMLRLNPVELETHTGQKFSENDPRRVRFQNVTGKLVNQKFAIDLVAADPIVVTELRTVVSTGGGPLGHPKVYINVDKNQVHVCDYSGRRFIKKKFYNEAVHGKSITYDQYLEQVNRFEESNVV
jgi:NADH dehydrogenase (ubiquinone) Fe-S protein 6